MSFTFKKYLTFLLLEQAGAVEGVKGPPLPASCTAAAAPTATPALLNIPELKFDNSLFFFPILSENYGKFLLQRRKNFFKSFLS